VRLVDLAPIAEAALEAVRPAADAKGVGVSASLGARPGLVSGDPERLKQIVWNLLSNAVKFTPKGGSVRLEMRRVDSDVEVSVADTGIGIEPEFLPHVFDRFRQADGASTRRHGGLGLGLAIVRHLTEMHGGTAAVSSEGPGRGATFTVRFPLASLASEPEGAARSGELSAELEARLAGLRVLVVDDEPDAREIVSLALARYGAEVRAEASAAGALAQVAGWGPDVLIADIGMPVEDGYDLIRKVRALPAESGGGTPAVALTAYARVEDRLRVLDAGYQMHVPKPVEPTELVAAVASIAGPADGRPRRE
jgi:CheY-like chemotaxis protein